MIVQIALLAIATPARAQSTLVPAAIRELAPNPSTSSPFILSDPVTLVLPTRASREVREIGEWFAELLRAQTGYRVTLTANAPRASVRGVFLRFQDGHGSEGYSISVRRERIVITASQAAGLRWGFQTLRQLLPPEFESVRAERRSSWEVAATQIVDAPRFRWRGSMVDVSRHFFDVNAIKRHIDLLSRYKLNVFHWHLTDDQGWRLAIKAFPKLTTVGAFRTNASGERYGGYFTRADVQGIVEYARRRGVMVVPEIEMPGHAMAALASYPELGCTGEAFDVPTQWGVFSDVLCPGSAAALPFLRTVLDEVIRLFPGPFIHLGGDEVPKDRWRACATCQALMRQHHLGNEEALQRWFIGRVAAYLATRGKRAIGWDEVLDGGFARNGLVQSWRDSSYTRKAAEAGHDVIASPSEWTYLNRSPAELTLQQVYAFEALPPGLPSPQRQRVLGGEVPFWSEHITSGANLELMALPRLLAFAEAMWSPVSRRDFASFSTRLHVDHSRRLSLSGFSVGPADQALAQIRVAYDSSATLRLRTAPSVVVRGTTDGSSPSLTSPIWNDGASLPPSGIVRLQAFAEAGSVLEERIVRLTENAGRSGSVSYEPAPDRRYPGTGPRSAIDGLVGSPDHGDGLWLGWWGPDVTITVDLGSSRTLSAVTPSFLQNIRSWISFPRSVDIATSIDGVRWAPSTSVTHDVPILREGAIRREFGAQLAAGTQARFVRVVAHNAGVLPIGHLGAGQPSWLFLDEVVIR